MNEGWICPSCKRGVAPGEKYCDHGNGLQPQTTRPVDLVSDKFLGPDLRTGRSPLWPPYEITCAIGRSIPGLGEGQTWN